MTALQRGMGLLRIAILTWLMAREQYALLGLGIMLINIAGPIMTLGANSSLERYVNVYEAAGRLGELYRKMCIWLTAIGLFAFAGAMCASGLITKWVLMAGEPVAGVDWNHHLMICWLALANGLLLAFYTNIIAFLRGLRAYRMVSVLEIMFGLSFTILAVVLLLVRSSALIVLVAHAVSLAGTLAFGMCMLHLYFRGVTMPPAGAVSVDPEGPEGAKSAMLRRMAAFGFVSLIGTVLWIVNQHISFFMATWYLSKDQAGVFYPFLRLGQPVLLLAQAAWTVVFVHVAKRWESGHRIVANGVMETSYKGLVIALVTLGVMIHATSQWWVLVLKPEYREGRLLVGPLMMSFQVVANMAILAMTAKLHERPSLIVLAGLAGGLANWCLAAWWVGPGGLYGVACAAGVGQFIGVGIVSVIYLRVVRPAVSWTTIAVQMTPLVLLLPGYAAVGLWAVLCVLFWQTGLVFQGHEKRLLVAGAQTMLKRARRKRT